MARKKISEMTIKECWFQIADNEQKCSEILDQIEPLKKKVGRLYNRNTKLKDRIATIKSNQKKIDWNWLLSHDGDTKGDVRYNFMDKTLRKIGLGHSGYFPNTDQTCIQISLGKDNPQSLKKTMAGLKKVLPYLKPALVNNFVLVDIFEHTLSEFGKYQLCINRDKNIYQIRKISWGHETTEKQYDNLKNALEYIQKEHWYSD